MPFTVENVPVTPNGELKKIWEYSCTIEGVRSNNPKNFQFQNGGNVKELSNGDLFVNISGSYNKLFIVSPDKSIQWAAIPEVRAPQNGAWVISRQYKAYLITRKDLEKLIWTAEGA